MAIIDLMVAIDKLDDSGVKLSKVKLYGKLGRKLTRPSNLFDNVTLLGGSGGFIEFQVFAIDLSAYQDKLAQMGFNTSTSIYMVHGSLALYINTTKYKDTTWCCCEGTVRYGTKERYPYLTMFKFVKIANRWEMEQNELTAFDTTTWDISSIEFDFAKKCLLSNSIVLPKQAESLPAFVSEPSVTLSVARQPKVNVSVYDNTHSNMVYIDKSVFIPTNRVEPLRDSEIETRYNNAFNALVTATKSKQQFIQFLTSTFESNGNCNRYMHYMFDAILLNLKRKVTSKTQTGQALLKEYLYSVYPRLAETNYMGVEAGAFVIDSFEDVVAYMYNGTTLPMTDTAFKLCFNAFGNPEQLYAFVCAKIFSLNVEQIMDACELCYKNKLSFSQILNENPYVLQCICGLSYDDVETIAMSLGVAYSDKLAQFKNIALLDSYIMGKDSGSTLFSLDYLGSHPIGLSLTERQYELCRQNGTYLSDWLISNVNTFVKEVNRKDLTIDLRSFRRNGHKYEQVIPMSYVEQAIKNYTQLGLGVLLEDRFITSHKLLSKELFVFNFMYELGQEETGYTDEQIDSYIDDYEREIGFKLEPEQRQAVHLLKYKAACVAGSAGSGKTTTSNCFTYVLDKLENGNVDFKYATPTGKAAKRLQEVVKKPVKTMCSMFKTFKETESLFDVDDETEEGYNSVYIFDENAMVTIDLLYSCLLKIKNSKIYLFGDFHQLPPIGKGLPFKNLLRILPCQFLTVSKRAAEGSGITLNSNYINEFSDSNSWRNLESSDDFVIAPCNEQDMVKLTVDIVKYYLNDRTSIDEHDLCRRLGIAKMPEIRGLTADDIQVVTPLAKNTYAWGANKLNEVLQPIFNKNKHRNDICFYQTSSKGNRQKYIIGDRVIHTNRNMYNMQWYADFNIKTGEITKRYGFGINNGEVGKVVGFIKASDCSFIDELDVMPDNFQYPEHIRDDSTFTDVNGYFLIVKYYDYLSDSDFYILYRCKKNVDVSDNEGLVLKGDDFSMLNLFYAGTCHKMQGSQARLIIAPLGTVNFTGFITRNMMYTVYTRASDCVITLGSVDNSASSMLTRARKVVSETNVFTVGEYLCSKTVS